MPGNLSKQRGGASLIFVLLIALVVTSSTDNAIKSLKNSQEVNTAVNAISHAQTGAWVGVEAVRLYLQTLDADELRGLGGAQTSELDIGMDPLYGTVTAENINSLESATDTFEVTLDVVNRHAAAQSSASLQVHYDVVIASPPVVDQTPNVLFNGGLGVNGGIELLNSGKPIDLSVEGDFKIGGAGFNPNPINELRVTGKVTIESPITINTIFADDDVTLANTHVQNVRTLGDLTITGSSGISDIIANGNVTIDSTGQFDSTSSRKNITINGGGGRHGVLTAGETIDVNSAKSVESINAVGDVSINGWLPVGDVISERNIKCPSPFWNAVNSLSANGSLINCPTNNTSLDTTEGANNTVILADELTPATLITPNIDVWELSEEVNYFVEYDDTNNLIQVTVNNIAGIPDGSVFTLATYNTNPPFIDYLCSTTGSDGRCITPSTPTVPLCLGYSLYNRCIQYNNGTFTIQPNLIAPGIVFFDGSLVVGNGHSISTLLASGNISTQGQFRTWAANRGGYNTICDGNADHAISSVRKRYTQAYSTHYPTNLCDKANNTYIPLSIGNVALMAGGVNPDTTINPKAEYTGGNISLGSSTDIRGAVLAGNFLTTNGNVNIRGLVNAAGLGDQSSGRNKISGSTTIDLQTLDGHDPLDLPIVNPTPPSPPMNTSTLTWARPK